MPLMKPLPGDLADRQTILELKINHCNAEFDEDKSDPMTPGPYGKRITTVEQAGHGKFIEKTTALSRTLVNKGAVNVAPFLDELDLVRKELEKKWVPDLIVRNRVDEYDKLYSELEEVNLQLWDLEDQIRALKVAPSSISDPPFLRNDPWKERVVTTAFAICDSNDKRSELIKKINALWNYKTQEKMY